MRAQQIADKACVTKDTLRYYEKIGLISTPERTAKHYRVYTQKHLKELKFIKYAKSVGFELEMIKQAIPHLSAPNPNCPLLKEAVQNQLIAIDRKIEDLKLAKQNLLKMI